MAAMSTISFARGAPSLDIVDVEGLREAAQQAFTDDPGGTTAYGTSVGYVPLREWIAEQHGVGVDQLLVTTGSPASTTSWNRTASACIDPLVTTTWSPTGRCRPTRSCSSCWWTPATRWSS